MTDHLREKQKIIDAMAEVAGLTTLSEDIKAFENARVIVSGAGYKHANGAYTFDGFFNGVPKYSFTTTIVSDEKEEEMKLTLFRCRLRSGQLNWYLSQMHPSQPGTEKDVDYYLIKSPSTTPPAKGNWSTTGKGENPPPSVLCKDIPIGIFDGKEEDFDIPPAPQASVGRTYSGTNNFPPDFGSDADDTISHIQEESNPNDDEFNVI